MKKSTKIWLITAGVLIVCGILIFGGAMTAMGWNFSKLSTDKFETNTYELNNEIKNISIDCDTADIEILPLADGESRVICYEHINETHEVTVTDGTLKIKLAEKRKWYEHIGISLKSPKITVYLPEGEYGTVTVKNDTGSLKLLEKFSFENIDVQVQTGAVTCRSSAKESIKIKASTGMISISDLSCSALSLKTSTGAITVENAACEGDVSIKVSTGMTTLSKFECGNLSSTGDTGGISLERVMVKDKLSIERSTGGVKLEASDAAEIYIKTDTGNVRGTLLSDKIFFAESETGSVKVPKTMTGGKCEIITDTGDIKIEIE